MDDDRPADRGKRRFVNAKGGNVIYADPRKRVLRFGAVTESGRGSATATEKERVRNHCITTVQRHLVQKAAAGVKLDLTDLGGIQLTAPRNATAPRHPPSVCSSQNLGNISVGGSIRSPAPGSEVPDPEQWGFLYENRGSSSGTGSARSKASSRVKSILSRCGELRKEIEKEKEAASQANARIQTHAASMGLLDDPLLDTVQRIAKANPRAREQIRKLYDRQAAEARQPAPLPAICVGNPPIPVLPKHTTKRHYKTQYNDQGLLRDDGGVDG